MICPSLLVTSFITPFNLSSNSPLNLAPAMREPISRDNSLLSFKDSGTSPFAILWASPSTIAVLPTPGSPIRTGLFFVLLERTCITLLISSSLPITGSSLSSFADLVRSLQYLSREAYWASGSWLVIR